jgi:hypothetical protein
VGNKLDLDFRRQVTKGACTALPAARLHPPPNWRPIFTHRPFGFLYPDEAVAYSKANNLSFIETSALDATNVKKAFEKYGPQMHS